MTARKREESLIEAPLTITALTGEQLDERGVEDLTDLQSFAPGLTVFTFTNRSYGQLLFRGMNNANILDVTAENASLFIDGVYYPGSIASLTIDDVERVEIVKGPQSAFFGRATFAGAVNLVPRSPSEEFGAEIKATLAQFDEYGGSLSVEGPLGTDVLRGRVSAGYREFGGDYDNSLTGEELGSTRDANATAVLEWVPNEAFSATLRGMYADQLDGAPAGYFIGAPQFNCGPFGGTNNGGDPRLFCGTVPVNGTAFPLNGTFPSLAANQLGVSHVGLDRQFAFGSLKLEGSLPRGFTLSSMTGYADEEFVYVGDADITGSDYFWNAQDSTMQSLSQELRLATPEDRRVRGMIGVSYLDLTRDFISRFIFGPQQPAVVIGALPSGFVSPATPNRKDIENRSVFGSISVDLLPQVTVSVEGRYQEDEIVQRLVGRPSLDISTKRFLPRLVVDYSVNEDTTVYVNVSRGNKPTQANTEIPLFSPERQAILGSEYNVFTNVPEELLDNYEVGTRLQLFDGRAQVSVAAFYMDWKNKQGRRNFLVDWNNNGVIDLTATGNDRESLNSQLYTAGDADVYGAELEWNVALTERVLISGNLAYSDVDFRTLQDETYFRIFGTLDASDQREPKTPRFTGALSGEYRAPLDDSQWFVRGDIAYTGTRYEYLFNKAETGAATRVNLFAGLDTDRYSITAFIKNAFDDDTPASIDRSSDLVNDPAFRPQGIGVTLPRRRQIGVELGYRF